MTKLFTLIAVVLLLASPAAMADDAKNTNISSEDTITFDTDTYDEDGCFC